MKKKDHPSMMISSSKVSGMVNFLSTVNIGKLSKKIKIQAKGQINSILMF